MKYKKLKEIIEFNPQEKINKKKKYKKIKMEDIKCFNKNISQYSIEEYNGGMKFRNGDTLLARITPCLENGKTAQVDILEENEIGYGSSEYIVMRPKDEISDKDYIYYLAISPFFRDVAIKSMVGTSGRQRVQLDVLKNLEMLIPDYEIQVKIGKILSKFDEKININNKTNDNLYKMMKIKFEDWITNLNKYEVSSLSKIANYTNGLAMQKFRPKDNEESLPVIKIKEMNDGITENTERCSTNIKDEVIINNGDVLFAWSGTLCMSIWGKGKAGLNQHIFKVTSDKYPKWFYYFWTLKHLNKFKMIAAGKATTMGHIKRGELDISEVLIPEDKELQEMHKIMQPLFNKYINNLIQNETLTQLRDTLLPKLMNGEIDLDKIEI